MCGTDQIFDQSFQILDLGPRGYIGPVELKFFKKPIYGSTISVVACTDHEIRVNIRDSAETILLHVAARTIKNDFGLNHFINGGWGPETKLKEIPVKKGVRFSLIMHYEKDGYRIFINGNEIAFYNHHCENIATRLEISDCQLFKVSYFTTTIQCN